MNYVSSCYIFFFQALNKQFIVTSLFWGAMALGILCNSKETSEAHTCFEHQKPGGSASKPQMEHMVCSTYVCKLKPIK